MKKNVVLKKAASILLCVTVGGIFGVLGFNLDQIIYRLTGRQPSMAELFINIAAFFVFIGIGFWINTLFHEVGHYFFGKSTGYSLVSFRIGSKMFIKRSNGFEKKTMHIKGTGGQCIMRPPEPFSVNVPVALYLLGGSIFNFFLFMVSAALAYLSFNYHYIFFFFALLSITGLLTAIQNAVPLHFGIMINDGYNLKSIMHDPQIRLHFWQQLTIVSAVTDGVAMADMPDEWFSFPKTELMGHPLSAAMALFSLSRAIESENFEQAILYAKSICDKSEDLLPMYRNQAMLELYFSKLLLNHADEMDCDIWEDDFQIFLKSSDDNPSVHRFMYAHALLVQKDNILAETYLESFERSAQKYPYPSEIESERQLMKRARHLYVELYAIT